MTRDDFTREWCRLCDGFSEPAPNTIRMEALYQRFGQRGKAVLHEFVNSLLLEPRLPQAGPMAKAFADVCSRHQEFEAAINRQQSPTLEQACRSEYSSFRCGIIIAMLTDGLTPSQVADRLEAAMPRFPEISRLEVETLRASQSASDPWAEAHRRTVGVRFTNQRDPDDLVWQGGRRIPRHEARP